MQKRTLKTLFSALLVLTMLANMVSLTAFGAQSTKLADFEDGQIPSFINNSGSTVYEVAGYEEPSADASEISTKALKVQGGKPYIIVPSSTERQTVEFSFDMYIPQITTAKTFNVRMANGDRSFLSSTISELEFDSEGNATFGGQSFSTKIEKETWYSVKYVFSYSGENNITLTLDAYINDEKLSRSAGEGVNSGMPNELFLDEGGNGDTAYYDNVNVKYGTVDKTYDFEDGTAPHGDGTANNGSATTYVVETLKYKAAQDSSDMVEVSTKALKVQAGRPYIIVPSSTEKQRVEFSFDMYVPSLTSAKSMNVRMANGDSSWLSSTISELEIDASGNATFGGQSFSTKIEKETWYSVKYVFSYSGENNITLTLDAYINDEKLSRSAGDGVNSGMPNELFLDEGGNGDTTYYDNVNIKYGTVDKTYDFEDGTAPHGDGTANNGSSSTYAVETLKYKVPSSSGGDESADSSNLNKVLKIKGGTTYVSADVTEDEYVEFSFDICCSDFAVTRSFNVSVTGGSKSSLSNFANEIQVDTEGKVTFCSKELAALQANKFYTVGYRFTYLADGTKIEAFVDDSSYSKQFDFEYFTNASVFYLDSAGNASLTYYDNVKLIEGTDTTDDDFTGGDDDNPAGDLSDLAAYKSTLVETSRIEENFNTISQIEALGYLANDSLQKDHGGTWKIEAHNSDLTSDSDGSSLLFDSATLASGDPRIVVRNMNTGNAINEISFDFYCHDFNASRKHNAKISTGSWLKLFEIDASGKVYSNNALKSTITAKTWHNLTYFIDSVKDKTWILLDGVQIFCEDMGADSDYFDYMELINTSTVTSYDNFKMINYAPRPNVSSVYAKGYTAEFSLTAPLQTTSKESGSWKDVDFSKLVSVYRGSKKIETKSVNYDSADTSLAIVCDSPFVSVVEYTLKIDAAVLSEQGISFGDSFEYGFKCEPEDFDVVAITKDGETGAIKAKFVNTTTDTKTVVMVVVGKDADGRVTTVKDSGTTEITDNTVISVKPRDSEAVSFEVFFFDSWENRIPLNNTVYKGF